MNGVPALEQLHTQLRYLTRHVREIPQLCVQLLQGRDSVHVCVLFLTKSFMETQLNPYANVSYHLQCTAIDA
jgi:hypothetical protein